MAREITLETKPHEFCVTGPSAGQVCIQAVRLNPGSSGFSATWLQGPNLKVEELIPLTEWFCRKAVLLVDRPKLRRNLIESLPVE